MGVFSLGEKDRVEELEDEGERAAGEEPELEVWEPSRRRRGALLPEDEAEDGGDGRRRPPLAFARPCRSLAIGRGRLSERPSPRRPCFCSFPIKDVSRSISSSEEPPEPFWLICGLSLCPEEKHSSRAPELSTS